MRIHKVTIQGFGTFKGTEVIDFDAFAEDGMFVITGKTGAGKTTILDAITFALYGEIPRYENAGAKQEDFRSKFLVDSKDVTKVTVEFSQADKRYRIWRTPTYLEPGRKSETQTAAEIVEITGETEIPLASKKVKDVAIKVNEIVKLKPSQFKQVVLLAQGEFQKFLVSKSDDRRDLLRQLFNSGRFNQYSTDLDQMRIELEKDLSTEDASLSAQVKALAGHTGIPVPEGLNLGDEEVVLRWAEPMIGQQEEIVNKAEGRVKKAKSELEKSLKILKDAEVIADRQIRRAKALEKLSELNSQKDEIAKQEAQLQLAIKADSAFNAVETHDEEVELHRAAVEEHGVAVADFEDAFSRVPDKDENLDKLRSNLEQETGSLNDLVDVEESLSVQEAGIERAGSKQQKYTDELDRLATKKKELDAKAPDPAELKELRKKAEDVGPASKHLEQVEKQLEAAQEIVDLEKQWKEAEEAAIDARNKFEKVAQKVSSLRTKRLEQIAGSIAKELIPGEPCAVCGSLEHPRPASVRGAEVTDEEIEKAEAAEDRARATTDKAQREVVRLKAEIKVKQKTSGNQSITEVRSIHKAAVAREKEAIAASKNADKIDVSLKKHQEALSEVSEKKAELEKELAALAAELKGQKTKFAQDTKKVENALGGFASISARRDNIDEQLGACSELINAKQSLATAEKRVEAAAVKLEKALKTSGFDSPKAVKQALLDEAEQTKIKKQIESYAVDTQATERELAKPELQQLPDKPIDLAPLQVAKDAANLENEEALIEHGSVSDRATTITSAVRSIEASLKSAGAKRKDFEIVERLAQTLKGQPPNTKKMSLETFALAADLEEIVAQANVLLSEMTASRYELKYSDERTKGAAQSGLSIEVIDSYNGEGRLPESLSGGEKFQASLALALGLAEVVTGRNGGVRLDTLFIDEGFGALDEETLDQVLNTLDGLREGGRTVGLITHVDKVKERIPNHLDVKVIEPGGWSTVKVN